MNRFYVMVVPDPRKCQEVAVGGRGWGYKEHDTPVVFWYRQKEDAESNQIEIAAEHPNCLVTMGEVTKAVRFPVGELNKVKLGSFGVLPDND